MARGLPLQRLEEWQAAVKAVQAFFQDSHKTQIWMREPNPLLGGVSPATMIAQGRADKLMQFIETSLRENQE